MPILFFDTETTGMPHDWGAPLYKLDNWPRMVQIAWLLYDDSQQLIDEKDYIIRPERYTIPQNAINVHGIDTETAQAKGHDLTRVLHDFSIAVSRSNIIVAHNMSFDEKIVGAEFLRKNVEHQLFDKKRICTMRESTNFCAIPGRYGYKWPKLSELHYNLFGEYFKDAHDAAQDVKITSKCFWELHRRGIIVIPTINTSHRRSNNTSESFANPEFIDYSFGPGNFGNQTPSSYQSPESIGVKRRYAGFWLRFIAFLVDVIIMFIINSVLWPIMNLETPPGYTEMGQLYIFQHPVFYITNWLYFAAMESSQTQATLGKMAIGLKVTGLENRKIGFGKATGRYFGKLISGIILYIGFFMAGFTKKKQALHDMMAGCLVVKNNN